VVANAALAGVLRSLVTATADANKAAIDALESCFHRRFGRQVSRPILHRSVERGWDVARHIADWSRGDDGDEGYLRNFAPGYIPPTGPGLWVPTPPGFQPMPQPSWGANGCLAIPDGSSCSPGEPTPFSHDPDSTFFADATEVYGRSTISRRSRSRPPGCGPTTPLSRPLRRDTRS
jgi:hypothetical protein